MQEISQITLGLMVISVLLSYGNIRWNSPTLGVFNRWMRWLVFSFGVASISTELGWTVKPFWLVALTSFLGWFLLETIYTWLIISAVSHSPIPLFPTFRINRDGDEWPAQRKFISIRDWLRSSGFKKLQSMKSELQDELLIRSTIYQDTEGRVRLQVLFFPQRSGGVSVSYIASSISKSGERYVTDNVYLPFGGYYPENWYLIRRPLNRSLEKLLKIHRRRIRDEELELWTEDEEPITEINQEQRYLEQTNMRQGFLMPYEFQEEYGRLSKEGRYRIWKEIWLLNYFGTTVEY